MKGNAEGFSRSLGRERKIKERTFSASVTDVSFAGCEHPELNAVIQAMASQRVAPDLGQEQDPHTWDHDPTNFVFPPHMAS